MVGWQEEAVTGLLLQEEGMIIEGTIKKSGKNGPPLRIVTWPGWDLQHPVVVEIDRPIWVLRPKGEKTCH